MKFWPRWIRILMKPALAEVGVLITRPAGQAGQLAELVAAAGGKPVLFPALEIEPLEGMENRSPLNAPLHFDLLIFVSPNAVRVAMPHIRRQGGIAAGARVAAVGPGTVAELKKSGVRNIISPRSGFDSEALIRELSSLALEGSRALIIRGQGGRELLGETLRLRGIEVTILECYRRKKPDADFNELLAWRSKGGLRACVATSSAIVVNLFSMAGDAGRSWLSGTTFFVSHPRVAATAISCGVRQVIVAGVGDEALVTAMKAWFPRNNLRPPIPLMPINDASGLSDV